MDARLPKRLRHAPPEVIAKYQIDIARKAYASGEAVRQLFRQRMQREGRLQEYEQRLSRQRDLGKGYRLSVYAVMREMGYQSPAKERRLHDTAMCRGMLDRRYTQVRKFQKKRWERLRMEDFEKAISGLPARAEIERELNWVRVHPAMTRRKRMADKSQDVEITCEDILSPIHGPAPSQYAANMLSHWVDNPGKFFEIMASEDKKEMNTGQAAKTAELVADDTGELDDLLNSYSDE